MPRWAARLLQKRCFLDLAVRFKDRQVGKPLVEPITRRLAAFEYSLSPADLWNASVNLHIAARNVARFLQEYDVLLTPVMGELPWPLGFLGNFRSRTKLREQLHRYAGYTPICNAAGMPAMSVPIHRTAEGIPVARTSSPREAAKICLLQLAAQLEQTSAWNSSPSPPAV